MLEVEGLVKKYGDFEAVKGIDFEVQEGEVFGLLGPNGAGKTQTISMLTGVISPSSGTARIGGHDIHEEMNEVKKINGLVPQDLALYPTLSARANLEFFGRIYGLHGKELKERVEDVLRIVALTERADKAVDTYSGGMKRRVNIAAGLLHQPRLLFLDEPTVGVDPQSRNHIFESVMRLNRERGMSIVYTSHYMEEVELLCKRVAIIDEGRIIAMDTIKNLIALLGGGVIQLGLERVDDALVNKLSGLPGVVSAEITTAAVPAPPAEDEDVEAVNREPVTAAPIVKIVAKNSQQAIVNVINHLTESNVTLTSLEILEPNLESVFLHLTGKKLRE
ncbi:MAG: ATP-binding cassette domain-containing protein [Anaerolineales bacterium]|nr:MAG: ATP-binding cassette domain-containing protein [Anaerolineales bacterium]